MYVAPAANTTTAPPSNARLTAASPPAPVLGMPGVVPVVALPVVALVFVVPVPVTLVPVELLPLVIPLVPVVPVIFVVPVVPEVVLPVVPLVVFVVPVVPVVAGVTVVPLVPVVPVVCANAELAPAKSRVVIAADPRTLPIRVVFILFYKLSIHAANVGLA
jgi:hypothetical protein